jgi:hypothetical protein
MGPLGMYNRDVSLHDDVTGQASMEKTPHSTIHRHHVMGNKEDLYWIGPPFKCMSAPHFLIGLEGGLLQILAQMHMMVS